MEPQVPSPKVFRGDSFMSASSADMKKMPARLRRDLEKHLFAHVDRRTDILWQEKPARVLAYKASSVHQYGWIPFNPFKWRNVKATVFSSVSLNVQTVFLVVWALIIHRTGLGLPEYDIRAFLKIWGTVYAGAVFNLATVVVFILGLFISLVINRWWSIRTAYAKFVSACSELTMMAAVNVRDARESHGARAARARLELVRLINLTHVLVCIMADGANKVYAKSSIQTWWDNVRNKKGSTEGEHTFGRASMHTLGYLELSEEGLVNEDEWETILANEAYGMPRYMTVMYWVEALILKCKEKGAINPTQQTMQAITGKVGAISDSATSIFTLIRSQMPYPYVHLVSFTVHFYLFFWATYVGCLLHAGIPDGSVNQAATTSPLDVPSDGVSADDAWAQLSSLDQVTTSVRHAHRADGWFNLIWAYISIAFANAVFQGLLNIHVLLDNPYGDHCTKFPLRAQIVELLNASRTMLSFTDQLPSVVAGIFVPSHCHPKVPDDPVETCSQTVTIVEHDAEGKAGHERPARTLPGTAAAAVQEHPSTVQATPQELGKMSETALSQVAEAIIHASRRHPSTAAASRPLKPSGREVMWDNSLPVQLDEPPAEHLFMQRARSIGAMSPYAPTNNSSPRSPSQPQARHRSSSHRRSFSSRKLPMLSRVSAPFRLVRSPANPSSPSSSHSHSCPNSQTVARSRLHCSPRDHSSHVRFQDDATLTPRADTSQQDSSEMQPDGTVSFTAEAQTSALMSSSNPSPRMPANCHSVPDGFTARSWASDLASTSFLMRVPSPVPHNSVSDGSTLGHFVADAAECQGQATAPGAQRSSTQSVDFHVQTSFAQQLCIIPRPMVSSPPDCATDASESPLAHPEAPTLLHSGTRPDNQATSLPFQGETQSCAAAAAAGSSDSLTLNMPAGVSGVGVQSHVLEHVISSQMSAPSGSSSASGINQLASVAAAAPGTPSQSLASAKSRRGFPPLVPKSPQQLHTGSLTASAGVLLDENELDDAALLAQGKPSTPPGATDTQQNAAEMEDSSAGGLGSTAGGRRWLRMFASPVKAGAVVAGGMPASGPQQVPEDRAALPTQHQSDQLAGAAHRPGATHSRPSDGSSTGQSEELLRMSSEAAQRRSVGPHEVFNPTTMMSPGDAKFLEDVQLLRREGSTGPQASSLAGCVADTDSTVQNGGNNAVMLPQAQPETVEATAEGSVMLSSVPEAAGGEGRKTAARSSKKLTTDKLTGSNQSVTDKTRGTRSAKLRSATLDDTSSAEAVSSRHIFYT